MVTNESGTIVARHDYLPYGVEIPRSGTWSVTDGLSPKFTGQDYDGETLLAFYQARHLASGLGRFMSVDPGNAGADLGNPQSWNMYGYVGGNPMVYVDPDGEDPCQPFDESGYCGESGAGVWNDDWFPWPVGGGWSGGSAGGSSEPNPGVITPSVGASPSPGSGTSGSVNAPCGSNSWQGSGPLGGSGCPVVPITGGPTFNAAKPKIAKISSPTPPPPFIVIRSLANFFACLFDPSFNTAMTHPRPSLPSDPGVGNAPGSIYTSAEPQLSKRRSAGPLIGARGSIQQNSAAAAADYVVIFSGCLAP